MITARFAKAPICYTGDIFDPDRAKYDLKYYVAMGKELKAAGAHVLGLKDMAGLLKPDAAKVLIKALKAEVGLPIHFHTHDTAGVAIATILAASEAGVDAVDCAMDALSGNTSQATLGSVVEALKHTDRDTGLTWTPCARSRTIGKTCAANTQLSRPACRPPPPRCICTKCPVASSPISRRRPRRWGWTTAGTRSPRPMPT